MIARKKAGSSGADRLAPSSTTGPANAPETTISYATIAPMLKPTTTSAPTFWASSAVICAYASVLKSCGAGAPACPGIVAAINRVPANAGSAINSAYERALHIPPGSSSTVCSASAGPDSTSSHSVYTRADYGTQSGHISKHRQSPEAENPSPAGLSRSRRGDSNSRPLHYECEPGGQARSIWLRRVRLSAVESGQ